MLRAEIVQRVGRRRASMNVGDVVTVRATGRRARIVDERGAGYYAVEYLPDAAGDPLDRDTVQSEQEEGMYREQDLELAE
jgi:hypothetical protein